jgi:hypothetical protein
MKIAVCVAILAFFCCAVSAVAQNNYGISGKSLRFNFPERGASRETLKNDKVWIKTVVHRRVIDKADVIEVPGPSFYFNFHKELTYTISFHNPNMDRFAREGDLFPLGEYLYKVNTVNESFCDVSLHKSSIPPPEYKAEILYWPYGYNCYISQLTGMPGTWRKTIKWKDPDANGDLKMDIERVVEGQPTVTEELHIKPAMLIENTYSVLEIQKPDEKKQITGWIKLQFAIPRK